MKVVLDTNVWISSLLLPKSVPGKIIDAWKSFLFQIVLSKPILQEIKAVLSYPKIRNRLSVSDEEVDEYLSFIEFFSEMVSCTEHSLLSITDKLRDTNDSHILATLIESQADYLVTGDKDLLVLGDQYPILTPGDFSLRLFNFP